MATIALTAIGAGVGGPIGGAIGAFIGSQIDKFAVRAIFGTGKREGPRVKELSVTTSAYGRPIARHYGQVRAAGTIIWATDLVEDKETTGGKNKPKTTTYSYSVSFAVALSSRPIDRVGRIWADGNLLRGAAGDLKAGGTIRIYNGHGDQVPDPLLVSALGTQCPAYRGLAYAVFEGLQLADFGNRIPALTFEVFAGDSGGTPAPSQAAPSQGTPSQTAPIIINLVDMIRDALPENAPPTEDTSVPLTGMRGFSDEGGPLASSLASIGILYPFVCHSDGSGIAISAPVRSNDAVKLLPPPAASRDDDDFGALVGHETRRSPRPPQPVGALRYYDIARDYQPGVQRAVGRTAPGRQSQIEVPAVLEAATANALIERLAQRQSNLSTQLSWRMAELDPSLRPGDLVRAPNMDGLWRIQSWEWRERGVELSLTRYNGDRASSLVADADPGAAGIAPDTCASPTHVQLIELPWDGIGSPNQRLIYAAAGGAHEHWRGAALYQERSGELEPIAGSGRDSSALGSLAAPLAASHARSFMPGAAMEVVFVSSGAPPSPTDIDGLAMGKNRILVGDEVIQFAQCEPLSERRWRLKGLLRGRGGTEREASLGHGEGAPVVLLDHTLTPIDMAGLAQQAIQRIAAIGRADPEPVYADLRGAGRSLRPLSPVHPVMRTNDGGDLVLGWTRRCRGGWLWPNEIELPLNEQSEAYRVGLGPLDAPYAYWDVGAPNLTIPAAQASQLAANYISALLWVRQIGDHAVSEPLSLGQLP